MNSNVLKSLGKLSIEEVLDNIEGARFFIPSLQRDFVWEFDRIEKFFDSIYREFPISNIILIKIDNEDKNITRFYKLKERFSKEDILTNDLKTRFSNNESLYCILDGQQRLTALYAGFNCVIPKKSFSKNETIYKMVLCFNLLHDGEDDSIFKFNDRINLEGD